MRALCGCKDTVKNANGKIMGLQKTLPAVRSYEKGRSGCRMCRVLTARLYGRRVPDYCSGVITISLWVSAPVISERNLAIFSGVRALMAALYPVWSSMPYWSNWVMVDIQ